MSNLTEEYKNQIDSMTYEQMLKKWRFASIGDPIFQGEIGEYFSKRMAKLREQGADHVGISKLIGWNK